MALTLWTLAKAPSPKILRMVKFSMPILAMVELDGMGEVVLVRASGGKERDRERG